MTYTPIPFGTTDWHIPVNDALTDQDARITVNESELTAIPDVGSIVPADHNLIAWTSDPGGTIAITGLNAGQLTMTRLEVREEVTLTNVYYAVFAAGAGLTAGQNFVGLYDADGDLLRSTADQTANFGTPGMHTVPWSTPVLVPAGSYNVAWLANGATPPTIGRTANWSIGGAALNVGLTAVNARTSFSGAGLTALPNPVNMAGRTLSQFCFWAALS